MTPADLRALLEKASPLPWSIREEHLRDGDYERVFGLRGDTTVANQAAIVAVMSAAPLLIELWEQAQKIGCSRCRSALDKLEEA